MNHAHLKEAKLGNGLRLIHLHTQNDPIAAAHLFIPGGTDLENDKNSGITYLMWSLLAKGTDKRNARQIAEDIEAIGASIGAGATHDYSELSCHSISEYFLPALEIMAEVLFRPIYLPAEVEKERSALISGIRAKKESIFTVANEELNNGLYGKHLYARPCSGSEKSVGGLTGEAIGSWRKKVVRPEGAVLAVASNQSFENVKADMEKLFGPSVWKGKKAITGKPKPTPVVKAAKSTRLLEKFEQAYLLIGFAAPPVSSKDYGPLKILNAVLGGGMSARLFQQLREQEGLAYDVGAFYASKKSGSAFVSYMGLQPSKLEEATRRIWKALKEVKDKPITKKELLETKNYIKGTYILDHQTNSQRAHYLGWWKILGLSSDFDKGYISLIDRVTVADVHRVAKKVLGSKPITVEIYPAKLAK